MEFIIETAMPVFILILGFAILVKGADWFVDGSAGIAEKLGVSKIFIALTIVAMGTSIPELSVSVLAAIQNNSDLSVGNILGTNILNILLILGFTAVLVPLSVQRTTLCFEIPIMIAAAVVFAFLGLGLSLFEFSGFDIKIEDGNLSRIDGIILLVLFGFYVLYLSRIAKIKENKNELVVYKMSVSWFRLIMIILIGLILVICGSTFTVAGATGIAKRFGVSDRIIGLTIVAFGTSLPELATSIIAATKKQHELAVGNIIGSNIFNMLFIGGVVAVICPVSYSSVFCFDSLVYIAVSIVFLLLLLMDKEKRITRFSGILMLLLYSTYFAKLILD